MRERSEIDRGLYNNNKEKENMEKIRLSCPSLMLQSSTTATSSKAKDRQFLEAFRFFERVRKQMSGQEYGALLECLRDYATGEITKVDMKKEVNCKFPELVDDFLDLLQSLTLLPVVKSQEEMEMVIRNRGTKQKQNKNMMMMMKKKKSSTMSTARLDHDQLTPSYRFLASYLLGNQRRIEFEPDDTRKDLNICCYSKCSSGSGYSVWPNDPVEKMLSQREDDLFERDMLMGWIKSTKDKAAALNASIAARCRKIKKHPISKQVKTHFKSYNFSVVEMMYGDEHGPQMVQQLLHSPQSVLPNLLHRLDQVYSNLNRRM